MANSNHLAVRRPSVAMSYLNHSPTCECQCRRLPWRNSSEPAHAGHRRGIDVQKLRPILIALLMLLLCAGRTPAQEPSKKSDAAPASETRPPIPPAPSDSGDIGDRQADPAPMIPGDVIWLKNDAKQLVPVPVDATLKEFLEWLKTRNRPRVELPDFTIAEISFTGTANDDRAELTANIKIQIQRDDTWVRVPLRMEEAFAIPGAAHQGVGEGVPAVTEAGFDQGMAWFLKGRGLHDLTVPMRVLIRKQPSRRLDLTLPKATATKLKIRIPTHVRILPLETSFPQSRALEDGSTEVEVVGLGERIDLRWMPQIDAEATLEAQTSLRLSLAHNGASVLLEAVQKIRARQGSFQRVKVQLPPGFELQRAFETQNGQQKVDAKQYGQEDVDAKRSVTVEFTEPTEGLVELKWELEAPFPTNGQLSLSGFQVERARIQQGEIAISSTEGFLIRHLGGESVRRVNISDLSVSSQADSAYRFNQQPYRLDLRIEQIEPQYGADPVYFLHTSTEGVELIADLRYNLTSGAVPSVELNWPGWRTEGWKQIDPPRTAAGAVDVEYKDDSWRIRVADPAQRDFRVRFRTRLEFSPEKSSVSLSLPRAKAPSPPEPIVVIVDDENVESKVEPVDGTVVRPVPTVRRKLIDLPEFLRGLNRTESLVDANSVTRFKVSVTVHQRQMRARAEVETELTENRLHVEQRIVYDVKFEPASEIGLLVPKGLDRRIVFSLRKSERDQEVQLNPVWTPQDTVENEKARVSLPEPLKGEFRVIARYDVPLPERAPRVKEAAISLPLVQSSDPRISPVQVAVRNSKIADLAVSDTNWTPQLSPTDAVGTNDSSTIWMTMGEAAAVPLKLSELRRDSAQDFTIQRSYVRTILHADGNVSLKARYRVEGALSTLEVGVPSGCLNSRFWWDDRPVEPTEKLSTDDALKGYQLQISRDVERGSHLLTIEYSLSDEGSFGWTVNRDLAAPRFTANVWTEQTVWEVVMPADRYLWSYPDGFVPRFHWERQSWYWSRVASPPYDAPASWIGAADGPAEMEEVLEGNFYVFSRSAPAATLRMVALHQSMVLLIGAGLALGGGFVLLKIPASRTVMTPLILAFVAALFWTFSAAPVQLLIQPAILGLLLAVLAAVIDGAFQRDRSSVLLTVAPSTELAPSHTTPKTSGSTASRPVILGAGSEDPTAMRPASDELAGSLSSYNSGASR